MTLSVAAKLTVLFAVATVGIVIAPWRLVTETTRFGERGQEQRSDLRRPIVQVAGTLPPSNTPRRDMGYT